jgi:endonuclease-3 related protein
MTAPGLRDYRRQSHRTIMGDQKLNEILPDVYRKLLKRYGPQHWWPAREPFEVIIGAILTQSTAWTNVEKAIANLKVAGKLSPWALRRLSEAELAGLIHPCGYYNVKARRLKAFVSWLGEYFDDNLEKLLESDTGTLRERLLDIHGIGEETADSILLYAGNKPVFVIDAYTRRIIDRMGLTPASHDYADYQQLFTSNLPEDVKLFNEYHALLVRHAKEVCRKNPLCQACCLNRKQKSRRKEAGGRYPCS